MKKKLTQEQQAKRLGHKIGIITGIPLMLLNFILGLVIMQLIFGF